METEIFHLGAKITITHLINSFYKLITIFVMVIILYQCGANNQKIDKHKNDEELISFIDKNINASKNEIETLRLSNNILLKGIKCRIYFINVENKPFMCLEDTISKYRSFVPAESDFGFIDYNKEDYHQKLIDYNCHAIEEFLNNSVSVKESNFNNINTLDTIFLGYLSLKNGTHLECSGIKRINDSIELSQCIDSCLKYIKEDYSSIKKFWNISYNSYNAMQNLNFKFLKNNISKRNVLIYYQPIFRDFYVYTIHVPCRFNYKGLTEKIEIDKYFYSKAYVGSPKNSTD